MHGWIAIHRKILQCPQLQMSDGSMDRDAYALWSYMLMESAWQDKQLPDTTQIRRGQFITSHAKLSKDTGLSIQQVRTLIRRFERGTMLARICHGNQHSGGSIYEVQNYDFYQTPTEQLTGHQQDTNRTSTASNNVTNKQIPYVRTGGRDGKMGKVEITNAEYDAAKPDMKRVRDALAGDRRSPLRERDRELVWRSVCLCIYRFQCPQWIDELITVAKETRPERPFAFWKGCLRRKVEKLGCDLNDELEAVVRATAD